MGPLGEYKKEIAAGAVIAVFGIAILTVISGYYFPATQSSNNCPVMNTPPSPKDAPVAGWEYLLSYNSTDGYINNLSVQSSCKWNSALSQQGLQGSTNTTLISRNVLGFQNGYLYMDITGNNYLPVIEANGYLNAFYVNVTSHMLILKPGVTFSSGYETAYYDGQPITNGTSIPDS